MVCECAEKPVMCSRHMSACSYLHLRPHAEDEALDYIRTMLGILLSKDGLRFEELISEEIAELAEEVT